MGRPRERRLNGVGEALKREPGRLKTETPGETQSSVSLLTDENLQGKG